MGRAKQDGTRTPYWACQRRAQERYDCEDSKFIRESLLQEMFVDTWYTEKYKYYHFTTVDTLVSMLTDSLKFEKNTSQRYIEFWATDINFMNDATERSLFVGVLLDRVKHFAKKQKRKLKKHTSFNT